MTFGSGGRSDRNEGTDLEARWAPCGATDAATLGAELIRAAQQETVPRALLDAFLDAVASEGAELVRLAFQARQDPEANLRRVITLAERLCASRAGTSDASNEGLAGG